MDDRPPAVAPASFARDLAALAPHPTVGALDSAPRPTGGSTMARSRRLTLSATLVAAIAAGSFLAGRAASEEPPAGAPGNMEEMMKLWEKMKTPGPQHDVLKGLAGNWVGTGTWTEMGVTSKFTEEVTSELVYGGRFIKAETKMTTEASEQMPAMSMTGTMYVGYDNTKQKYVHNMIGDWSTAIGTAEGTFDAATKTMTMTGTEVLAPGMERKFRMVQKFVSADEWTFEMYFTQPGGKEAKAGDAVYKRK
jgi:hypothetical protein